MLNEFKHRLTWQVRIPGKVGSSDNREACPEAWQLAQHLSAAQLVESEGQADLIVTDSQEVNQRCLKERKAVLYLEVSKSVQVPGECKFASFLSSTVYAEFCSYSITRISRVYLHFSSQSHAIVSALKYFIGSHSKFPLLHHQGINESEYTITNDLTHMGMLVSRGSQGAALHFDSHLRADEDESTRHIAQGLAFWHSDS